MRINCNWWPCFHKTLSTWIKICGATDTKSAYRYLLHQAFWWRFVISTRNCQPSATLWKSDTGASESTTPEKVPVNLECCPRGFEISSGNYSAPFGRIQILTPEFRNLWHRESPRTNFQYCWGGLKFQVLITPPLEAHPKSETGFGIYTLENAPHQIWSGYKVFCENMVVSVVLGRHRVIACVDKHWRECQTNWCNKPSVRVGVVEILIATVVKVWGKHGHQGLRISISLFFRSRTSKKGSGFDLVRNDPQLLVSE